MEIFFNAHPCILKAFNIYMHSENGGNLPGGVGRDLSVPCARSTGEGSEYGTCAVVLGWWKSNPSMLCRMKGSVVL